MNRKVFDILLNNTNGIIKDTTSGIRGITETTGSFYPNYGPNDPIYAYKRGYYFDGKSSIIHFNNPQLLLSTEFTIEC